jgi:hypothetical protein
MQNFQVYFLSHYFVMVHIVEPFFNWHVWCFIFIKAMGVGLWVFVVKSMTRNVVGFILSYWRIHMNIENQRY